MKIELEEERVWWRMMMANLSMTERPSTRVHLNVHEFYDLNSQDLNSLESATARAVTGFQGLLGSDCGMMR